jgi:transposase
MRGRDEFMEQLFTVKRLEDFVPADHPLRPVRLMVNEALVRLDSLFAGMYASSAKGGRPSIAPEKLMRAMLLQVFYSIRSERQLMEQVQYNLLYRWFIGLSMDGFKGARGNMHLRWIFPLAIWILSLNFYKL